MTEWRGRRFAPSPREAIFFGAFVVAAWCLVRFVEHEPTLSTVVWASAAGLITTLSTALLGRFERRHQQRDRHGAGGGV